MLNTNAESLNLRHGFVWYIPTPSQAKVKRSI